MTTLTEDLAEVVHSATGAVARRVLDAIADGAELVHPDDLMGTREVAELLGIDRTTASRWKSSGYLPTPFAETAAGPLWLRPVIVAFAEQHRASADAAGRRPVGTAAST